VHIFWAQTVVPFSYAKYWRWKISGIKWQQTQARLWVSFGLMKTLINRRLNAMSWFAGDVPYICINHFMKERFSVVLVDRAIKTFGLAEGDLDFRSVT
jgi:hypothetical protein